MSYDVNLSEVKLCIVYEGNITFNVKPMAKKLGIYELCFEPNGLYGKEMIDELTTAIKRLSEDPSITAYEAPNGWGTAEQFKDWLFDLRHACIINPNATYEVHK
jgi:hypothetical protein